MMANRSRHPFASQIEVIKKISAIFLLSIQWISSTIWSVKDILLFGLHSAVPYERKTVTGDNMNFSWVF